MYIYSGINLEKSVFEQIDMFLDEAFFGDPDVWVFDRLYSHLGRIAEARIIKDASLYGKLLPIVIVKDVFVVHV